MEDKIITFLGVNEVNISTIGVSVNHSMVYTDFPLHDHDFNETFIIVSGTATHVLGEWEYPLSRGDVFAIKGDAAHGFKNVQALEIINLMYDPGFFQQPYLEIRSIPGFDPFFLVEPELRLLQDYSPMLKLDDRALNHVVSMTDFMLEQQQRGSESLYPVLRMNFAALVSYLATQYDACGERASQVSALSRALAYMELHLAEPIRLADIAGSAFLSPRQLERLFQEYYKESPMKYLQKMRLKKALTLLVRQEASVASAARQSGFEDISYFTRVFRATYGITPTAARRHISKI